MLQVTIEGTGYWGFGDLDWWESADSLCWVNLRDVSITCFSCFQIVALPNDPGLVDDLRGTVVEAMPSRSIKYIGKWSSLLFLWIQPTSEFVDFAKNISTQRRWVEHFFSKCATSGSSLSCFTAWSVEVVQHKKSLRGHFYKCPTNLQPIMLKIESQKLDFMLRLANNAVVSHRAMLKQ